MRWLVARLSEPSTYAGASAVALVLQDIAAKGFSIPNVIGGVFSLIAVFKKGQ